MISLVKLIRALALPFVLARGTAPTPSINIAVPWKSSAYSVDWSRSVYTLPWGSTSIGVPWSP